LCSFFKVVRILFAGKVYEGDMVDMWVGSWAEAREVLVRLLFATKDGRDECCRGRIDNRRNGWRFLSDDVTVERGLEAGPTNKEDSEKVRGRDLMMGARFIGVSWDRAEEKASER